MFGSGTMAPADYMVRLADGKDAPAGNLNIRTIQTLAAERQFRFHVAQYLSRRAADWADARLHGDTRRLADAQRAVEVLERRAACRVEELGGSRERRRSPLGERDGVAERLMLRELLRRVEMKVIQENRLDVVVRLHTSLPPGKIGLAPQPGPGGASPAAISAWVRTRARRKCSFRRATCGASTTRRSC